MLSKWLLNELKCSSYLCVLSLYFLENLGVLESIQPCGLWENTPFIISPSIRLCVIVIKGKNIKKLLFVSKTAWFTSLPAWGRLLDLYLICESLCHPYLIKPMLARTGNHIVSKSTLVHCSTIWLKLYEDRVCVCLIHHSIPNIKR